MIVSASLFAGESISQKQMRWQMEEQTRIMQEQLKLQKEQLKEMQTQQNIIQGQRNKMDGGIDVSPIQNWLLNSN